MDTVDHLAYLMPMPFDKAWPTPTLIKAVDDHLKTVRIANLQNNVRLDLKATPLYTELEILPYQTIPLVSSVLC